MIVTDEDFERVTSHDSNNGKCTARVRHVRSRTRGDSRFDPGSWHSSIFNQRKTMSEPQHEAIYKGIPTQPTLNVNPTTKTPYVCVVMRITEGPLEGREFKFEQSKWSRESNVFTFRNMRGLGWQGKSMSTFVSDVRKAESEGRQIAFQARLAQHNGKTWWTADRIGGGTIIKQGEAPTSDTIEMMDNWIDEADHDDSEFRASRDGRGRNDSRSSSDSPVPGSPCRDCGEPLFMHQDKYLTCKNGHDTIPF